MKRNRRGKSHFTQWTGQFSVAAELSRRGYTVDLTLGNTPDTDLFCQHVDGGRRTRPGERASMIRASLPLLIGRLEALERERVISCRTGIVLIKKVVFETLAAELSQAGYRVLQCEKIDFPKYHNDRDTINGIRKALESLNAEGSTVG